MSGVVVLALLLTFAGCGQRSGGGSGNSGEVVIYSSIDEPYLRPLVQRFERESGISVRVVTDTEATKSASLAERILAEKDRPQCDVYWANEVFHTINLAEQGCFAPYRPKSADDIPARWRGAGDLYTDVGVRVRMIAISTRPQFKEQVAKIHGLEDLADPALKDRIGICHPGFGTASGHIAAIYLTLGEEKFVGFMRALRANDIKLLGGNSAVAEQVAAGTLIAGPTDNDDIQNLRAENQPIHGILPDQGPGGYGTLLIPGTVALVKNCPNPENARRLIEFICQPSTERELIDAKYLAGSVRDTGKIKAMDVDYVACAHAMKHAVETALTILQDREIPND